MFYWNLNNDYSIQEFYGSKVQILSLQYFVINATSPLNAIFNFSKLAFGVDICAKSPNS